MTLLGTIYSLFPSLRSSLQSLYFVPVVVSAVLLGWRKSSAFTVVGVSLVLCVSCLAWSNHSPREFIHSILWGCTLGTTGAVIALMVGAKERKVEQLLKKQSSLALTDQLTQVANRRAFDLEMRRRMSEQVRYERTLSLLMIDIDFFKKFNDRFGHSIGDQVLKKIAVTIQNCLREADLVARFGGEEFSVLLPNTNLAEAVVVAERIRSAVDQLTEEEIGCPQKLSVSVGVTEVTRTDDENAALERADIAMYAAKTNGRNQVFSNCPDEEERRQQTDHRTAIASFATSIFNEAQSVQSAVESVTGLPYLKVFDNELARRIYESARYGMDLCLGLVEVGFRNDPNVAKSDVGHEIGNLGRRIKQKLRESDLVCWVTEFEFAVLLPFTRIEDAVHVLRRLACQVNVDSSSFDLDPVFHVEGLRVTELNLGETKKQALENLRSSDRVDFDQMVNY